MKAENKDDVDKALDKANKAWEKALDRADKAREKALSKAWAVWDKAYVVWDKARRKAD